MITDETDWTALEDIVQEIRRRKLKNEAGRPPHLRALIGAVVFRALRLSRDRGSDPALRAGPIPLWLPEYVAEEVRVSDWSTVRVKQCAYSVPSRLATDRRVGSRLDLRGGTARARRSLDTVELGRDNTSPS